MAEIRVCCPSEVGVGGTAHIGILVRETLPFEFDYCKDYLEVWLYVNDKLITKIPLKPFIESSRGGRSISFEYQIVPKDESTYTVKGELKGGGTAIPPLSCMGTDEDTCTFTAIEGGSEEAYPVGWTPTNWLLQSTCILPFVCIPNWLLVSGVVLGAMYLYSKYEEQKEKEEMMYLTML